MPRRATRAGRVQVDLERLLAMRGLDAAEDQETRTRLVLTWYARILE